MHTISSLTVYRFDREVLVEILGTGTDGEVAVRSLEFDILDTEEDRVVPRGSIRDIDEQLIHQQLEAEGYTVYGLPTSNEPELVQLS